ncbi:RICIN domain-containing protein [Streptomyces sp. NPDC005209]|uniref:RICIN domain-containing protein n=1 Tax=Streptomyces sp. NPDC005209 TaxID=3156715 RepID=UPI0033B788D2
MDAVDTVAHSDPNGAHRYGGRGAGRAHGSTRPGAVDSAAPAAPPVDGDRAYRISGAGRVLAQGAGSATTSVARTTGSDRQVWFFTPVGDGSFMLANAATGRLLGVPSTSAAGRAWGTRPTVTRERASGPTVGQQWFLVPTTSSDGACRTGTWRLVNRYSGLTLGLSAALGRHAETTPVRSWTDRSGSPVGGGRTADEQLLSLTPVGVPAA